MTDSIYGTVMVMDTPLWDAVMGGMILRGTRRVIHSYPANNREYREAIEWINDESECNFSFRRVCSRLGIDPERERENLYVARLIYYSRNRSVDGD